MTSVFDLPPGMARVKGVHLYPYQADGVAFLVSKKRALLGDDMGLGKTRQAIVAMESAAPNGPVLVVCPASLKLNWRREILLVDKDARIEVLGFDREAQREPRWVIVNYDILRNRTAACRSLVGHHPRRGSFHQEQQPENLALLKTPRCRRNDQIYHFGA